MQEERVVAEMPLMKVGCEMEEFGSEQSGAANPVHGEAWVGGGTGQRAVPVVFHGLGAGTQDHG